MKHARLSSHPGTTMIELLLFLAILAVISSATLPILFSATENRLLQQTISIVEQNGTQIVQNTALKIRQAERVISPAIGQTGSVLELRTASGALNPTIIGLNSGSIVLIQHATLELVSSEQVAVQNFMVRNTSQSATQQSVVVSFDISRTIRLQQPYSYSERFEFVVNLLPDDVITNDGCSCLPSFCDGGNEYRWQVCQGGVCLDASTQLQCL